MLTISCEKEESRKKKKEKKFTRREYSYTSFSRSFTVTDEINKEKIEAKYEEDGDMDCTTPLGKSKKITAKQIAVK